MANQTYNIGDNVYDVETEEEVKITGYNRGWYELSNGRKTRESGIEPSGEEEMEDYEGEEEFEDEEDEEGSSKMARTLRKYAPKYVTSKTAQGRSSKRCGDELSQLLEGLDPDQVVALAAIVLVEILDFDPIVQYSGRNPGQKRMIAGNLLRNAMKREDIKLGDVRKGIKQL